MKMNEILIYSGVVWRHLK